MKSQIKIDFTSALVVAAYIMLGISLIIIPGASGESVEVATAEEEQRLKQVFPDADVFSAKTRKLPHHKAYRTNPDTGEKTLVGFVFITREVEPDEWAYSSEIEALVGLTTNGIITKVMMIDHYEPMDIFQSTHLSSSNNLRARVSSIHSKKDAILTRFRVQLSRLKAPPVLSGRAPGRLPANIYSNRTKIDYERIGQRRVHFSSSVLF